MAVEDPAPLGELVPVREDEGLAETGGNSYRQELVALLRRPQPA